MLETVLLLCGAVVKRWHCTGAVEHAVHATSTQHTCSAMQATATLIPATNDLLISGTLQRANFEFFLLAAAGVQSVKGLDGKSDYFIVLNGDLCTPCKAMDSLLGCVCLSVSSQSATCCCCTSHALRLSDRVCVVRLRLPGTQHICFTSGHSPTCTYLLRVT